MPGWNEQEENGFAQANFAEQANQSVDGSSQNDPSILAELLAQVQILKSQLSELQSQVGNKLQEESSLEDETSGEFRDANVNPKIESAEGLQQTNVVEEDASDSDQGIPDVELEEVTEAEIGALLQGMDSVYKTLEADQTGTEFTSAEQSEEFEGSQSEQTEIVQGENSVSIDNHTECQLSEDPHSNNADLIAEAPAMGDLEAEVDQEDTIECPEPSALTDDTIAQFLDDALESAEDADSVAGISGEQDEEGIVHKESIADPNLEIDLESRAASASTDQELEERQATANEASFAEDGSETDALMSPEEIEALLAAASIEVSTTEESHLPPASAEPVLEPAPAVSRVKPGASAGNSATLSEEEIAALMESAIRLDNAPQKIGPSTTSQSDLTVNETSSSDPTTGDSQEVSESSDETDIFDQEEEIELTEAELAMLVRQTIDDQAESLDAAVSDDEEDSGGIAGGKEVVGAEKLSALLEEPDPETEDGGPVPSESTAMDPDELAALMSEASEIASQGGSVGSGQPLTAGFEPSPTGETAANKAQPVSSRA
ncbi:hypothetical protein QM565_13310 [Geitlerinema splendidum]|nr:hypothetical protein [Geitlerinema splendidum]